MGIYLNPDNENFARTLTREIYVDKTQMICNCPDPILEIVNKKPIIASCEEINENPPSRSAKLRVARYIKK